MATQHLPPIRWVPCEDLQERQKSCGRMRAIWAQYDEDSVLVFQAYRPEIGRAAAAAGTLAVPGFSLGRTTWIKPSFLWMMHRSDWGRAQGQEAVLGIHVARAWFESALDRAVLSSSRSEAAQRPARTASDVVVQWDPDWSPLDDRQPWRAIQMGLRADAVPGYLAAIAGIVDLSKEVGVEREHVRTHGGVAVPDASILELASAGARQRLGVDAF